jgi:hypothetical protein
MDLVAIAIAGIGFFIAVVTVAILLVRWRRHQFRFSMRAMLLASAIIGCAIFAILKFVSPIVAHRLAVQRIYDSGGAVLFGEDAGTIPPGGLYSDLRKDNPWRNVAIVHAQNDQEATASAQQLMHLPEATCLFLGRSVSDGGLAEIGDSGRHPSLATIDFFLRRQS